MKRIFKICVEQLIKRLYYFKYLVYRDQREYCTYNQLTGPVFLKAKSCVLQVKCSTLSNFFYKDALFRQK